MITLEIPANPNCEAVELRVFHDLTPPQPVSSVRLECPDGTPTWCEVTGWTTAGEQCPAMLQKVDDSGDGVAFLLHGGDAGLRLRPVERTEPWQLENPRQWGAPFLIIADPADVRMRPYQEALHG